MTDAFTDAVRDAIQRLEQAEGRKIPMAEIARRMGMRPQNLNHHLNPNRTAKTRRVPPELIRALADVLPIDEAKLTYAAQLAAGYSVRETGEDLPDLRGTISRWLDEKPTKEEQMRTMAEVQRIMAEEMTRRLREDNNH